MSFNKIFSIFFPFLYLNLGLCFQKNIHISSNILCLNNKLCLYESIIPDILLPELNIQDKIELASGEMIIKQERNESKASGIVVLDIYSSPDIVFDTLTRFDMYKDMIPIVRTSKILTSDGINTMAEFTLNRFLLHINVKHTVFKEQRLVKFTLDPNWVNPIFKEAEGFWYVEVPIDRPEGYSRVYLSSQILTNKMVPTIIMDYAASKALPSATKWLKPFFMRKNY